MVHLKMNPKIGEAFDASWCSVPISARGRALAELGGYKAHYLKDQYYEHEDGPFCIVIMSPGQKKFIPLPCLNVIKLCSLGGFRVEVSASLGEDDIQLSVNTFPDHQFTIKISSKLSCWERKQAILTAIALTLLYDRSLPRPQLAWVLAGEDITDYKLAPADVRVMCENFAQTLSGI